MMETPHSEVGKIIRDFIELKEMSRHYARKSKDLKKEYNKLLTEYNGEAKNYSLTQAEKIYGVYCEMISYDEKSRIAVDSFNEVENKLKEIGRILYESTIHAEISLPAINGTPAQTRSVTVAYNNGQVEIY